MTKSAGEIVGDAGLPSGARLGLEPIDEIDGGEEAAARTRSDAASCDGDRGVVLAGPSSADQHDVALPGDEAAAGEVANDGLVDRSVHEGEVVDVLGERQLGDGELILD